MLLWPAFYSQILGVLEELAALMFRVLSSSFKIGAKAI